MKQHRFQILGQNPERVRVCTPAKSTDKIKEITTRLTLPTHPLEDVLAKFREWGGVPIKHPTMTIYKFDEKHAALVRLFFQ